MATTSIPQRPETCATELIARYWFDRVIPRKAANCLVCIENAPQIGWVCHPCYDAAREAAEMDETDGVWASLEGIAAELYRMEQANRAQVAHLPGEEDPIPWVGAETPVARRAVSRVSTWLSYPRGGAA